MILKVFKEKSIKKRINTLLSDRSVKSDNNQAETLGVILNIDEIDNEESFIKLAKEIKIQPNRLKILAFSAKKKDALNVRAKGCYLEDFNWNGVVKNIEVQSFLETDFDLLISYYSSEILELKLLTAVSKAKFKIGVLQSDERLNDLIIKTKVNEFSVFKAEVLKYLTILNKISKA
ncbi:DUF6913 domain-containing protein [Tamlana sp. I1]|uniref:DUF6913 domain-containing protein n=1 Tax=Tamlana sp. I1 TaxID=2762061 RepID=UPI0018907AA4|nr:hypothetical protein [Tamlana sp. I1]